MANNSKYPPREVVVSVDYAGKVPPYSESLEETVLGQLLINEDAIPDVMNYLKPEIFFIPKHQIIFKVMDSLYREASPITLMTVIDKLNAQNELDTIGGPAYISDLTMKVSSSANVEAHTKILVEKYIQRELISVSSQICEKAFSPECELSELTDFAEKNIMTVTDQSLKKRSIQNIKDVVTNVYDQVLVARDAKRTIIGLPTGFTKVDAITSGWQEGNMIVIAARPGMGKTAFVLTMLRNMAMDYGRSVAMFSLEMSCEQLATRLLVGEAELYQNKLRTGNLNETELDRLLTAKERLENAKIFFDDTPGISIYEFRSKCRRLVEKNAVECIVVDYLQLMTSGKTLAREQEVSYISRQIKSIAMELKIPIIALSQLNRSLEGRQGADKEPKLSDLRESGAIEQDADMVLFIHREAKAIRSNVDSEGNDISRKSKIIIEKNRHGANGYVEMEFIGEFMKFRDVETTFSATNPAEPIENQKFDFEEMEYKKSKLSNEVNAFAGNNTNENPLGGASTEAPMPF